MRQNNEKWIKGGRRKIRFIIAFNRPLTHEEINQKLHLSNNDTMRLQDWIDRDLVVCKTPSIYKGRIYELTPKGKRLRSIFIKCINPDLERSILTNAKSTKEYLNPPKNLDLYKYAKVVASPCLKIPVLDVLNDNWQRLVDEYIGRGIKKRFIPGIYTNLKSRNLPVNWSNLIDCLKEMSEIGVVEIRHMRKRKNYFKLTSDGIIIKDWIRKVRVLEMVNS
jgi:predicted transcriptional regulator